jgi:hypothetical protein
MRRLLAPLACALWLCGLAGASVAQDTVRVRSGEHADFSRLVFYLPEARDWRLGRSGDGYRIGFGAGALGFDTEAVFDFIPRTRLAALSRVQDGLQLDLACTCHAVGFLYRPGIVVLDIRDGPPPEGAAFEAPFDQMTSLDADRAPPAESAGRTEAFPGLVARFVAAAPAETALSLPQSIQDAPRLDTGALRADVVARMSAALSQGLVEPAAPGLAPQSPNRVDAPGAEKSADQPPGLTPPGTPPEMPLAASYRVSTAFDIAFRPRGAATMAAQECRPTEAYGFLLATPSDSPTEGLAAARSGLAEDPEAPSPTAVLGLARAYLALGFGAEAAQVLADFGAAGPEAGFLADLAAVMDRPGTTDPALAARLAGDVSCDSPGALWALLATGGRNLPDTIDDAAVLRAVSELPVHLRSHLAPALSQALRQARQDDLAHAVRETVHRTGQKPDPEMQLEDARATEALVQRAMPPSAPQPAAGPEPVPGAVTAEPVDPVDQAPRLASVPAPPVEPRPDPAPTEAGLGGLADVLEQMAEGRRALDDGTLAEAAALIHESKGSAAGVTLFEAFVPALVSAGRHREALAMMRRLRRSSYADSYPLQTASAAVLGDLATDGRAGDLILALAEGQDQVAPDGLPSSLRLSIASRLVDLGLLAQARRYAPPIGPETSPPARIVQARIALAEGEPMEALARIATLDGAEAGRLRAEALAVAGASADAARILRAQGEDATAAEWAWAGEDWSAAAALLPPGPRRELADRLAQQAAESLPGDADGPALAPPTVVGEPAAGLPGAADAGGQPVAAPDGPESYLAQRRTLLERSSELRETVRLSLAPPVQE